MLCGEQLFGFCWQRCESDVASVECPLVILQVCFCATEATTSAPAITSEKLTEEELMFTKTVKGKTNNRNCQSWSFRISKSWCFFLCMHYNRWCVTCTLIIVANEIVFTLGQKLNNISGVFCATEATTYASVIRSGKLTTQGLMSTKTTTGKAVEALNIQISKSWCLCTRFITDNMLRVAREMTITHVHSQRCCTFSESN